MGLFVTLPWDTPDEIGHLGYIKQLATGEGIPVFRENRMDEQMWRSMVGETGPQADYNWIAQHPPLYYTLMVPAYWVGSLFSEGFEGPLYAIRIWNALLMVVALAMVYQLARRFTGSEVPAFCLTAMVGSIPLVGQTAAGVNNDTLIVLVSVVLAFRWLIFSEEPDVRNLMWVGVAIGLCGITKYTLLLVMAPVAALALWRFVQERGIRLLPIFGYLAVGWGPLSLWVARNLVATGKPMPTALSHLVFESSTNYNVIEFFRAYPFFTHSFRSFWGIWGWHGTGQDLQLSTLHLPSSHQFIYASLVSVFAIVSLVILYKQVRSADRGLATLGAVVSISLMVGALLFSLFPHESYYVTWLVYLALVSTVFVVISGANGLWLTRQPLLQGRSRLQMESILVVAFFLVMVVRQMHDYSNEGGALRGTHGRYYFATVGILMLAWILPALRKLSGRPIVLSAITVLMVLAEFWLLLDEVIPFLNRDV